MSQYQINSATPAAQTSTLQIIREALTVDHVLPSQYKKNRASAQLRQVITKIYPTSKAGNSLSDSLFAANDFGFADKRYSSTRMAWIDVPAGTTKEEVEALLSDPTRCPNPGIQQIMSDAPILTDEQRQAIEAGLTTLDKIKYGNDGTQGQLARYGKNNAEGKPAEQFIPGPNGGEQFRATFFKTDISLPQNQDQDLRLPKVVVNILDEPVKQVNLGSATGMRSSQSMGFEITDSSPSAETAAVSQPQRMNSI